MKGQTKTPCLAALRCACLRVLAVAVQRAVPLLAGQDAVVGGGLAAQPAVNAKGCSVATGAGRADVSPVIPNGPQQVAAGPRPAHPAGGSPDSTSQGNMDHCWLARSR